jgi:aspartate aminotransferase-like enzyme
MRREGVEKRWQRHLDMLAATDAWLSTVGERTGVTLENIVKSGWRSPTVSTIRLPAAINGKVFVQKVKDRGIQLGGGYGKLGDTTFRIGHMGDHTVETLKRCFDACEAVLKA